MNRSNQKGAVSIFLVVFFALLITVVVVGFVRLGVRDQAQSTESDLNRSAYDSALAGVEDAKRTLAEYQSACAAGTSRCNVIRNAFNESCTALSSAGTVTRQTVPGTGNQETVVGGSTTLNQAYTCVNVNLTPDDYLGELTTGEVMMIPLKGVSTYTSVEISWTTKEDLGEGATDLPLPTTNIVLPANSATQWSNNRPAMLRAQFIRYDNGSIVASQFDSGQNSMTGFLYPVRGTTATSIQSSLLGSRQSPAIAPRPVVCTNLAASDEAYSCRATITFSGSGQPVQTNDTMYLALSSLYRDAHFKVVLRGSGGNIVRFDGVQPEIDATGRADSLFRRVLARVDMDGNFPYPVNAVDLTGNLCKNFSITSSESDYSSACRPNPDAT